MANWDPFHHQPGNPGILGCLMSQNREFFVFLQDLMVSPKFLSVPESRNFPGFSRVFPGFFPDSRFFIF